MLFAHPVLELMTSHVVTVRDDTTLPAVARALDEHAISAVPVVDASGNVVGVVSRTDLVRIGRREAGSSRKATVITLPDRGVKDVLGEHPRDILSVLPKTPLRDA